MSWIRQGLLTDHPVGSHHRVEVSEVDGLVEGRRSRARVARNRVISLPVTGGSDRPEPTPRELFAAALVARAGDRSSLEALGTAEPPNRRTRGASTALGRASADDW